MQMASLFSHFSCHTTLLLSFLSGKKTEILNRGYGFAKLASAQSRLIEFACNPCFDY